MEIASKNEPPGSFKNGFILEREGELSKAVLIYEKLLKKAPSDLEILSRLIIISRKSKNYRKELSYINQAIKIHQLKYSLLKSKDVKVVSLSKKLNALLGHTDSKGKNLLEIPEVVKLKKRRDIVLNKMKK